MSVPVPVPVPVPVRPQSPENIDKEFLRLWFRSHCDPCVEPRAEWDRDLVGWW